MSPKARRNVPDISAAEVEEFFDDHLPEGWFVGREILIDADEIVVIGRLASQDGEDPNTVVDVFREETRSRRIGIAADAESRWYRKVAWGVRIGDLGVMFTHLAVPAMTRLRIKERQVLDTLVESGVARSRADALAWCVRLVGRNTDEWLSDLRNAMKQVEEVRDRGPEI
jgi:hypothetical protein